MSTEDTLMDLLKQMKRDADRMNAETVSINASNVESIDGWYVNITIGKPGVGDSDE